MNREAQEKLIRQNSRLYQKALEKQGFPGPEVRTGQYEKRLREMLTSPQFQKHNVYPTMNVPLIYAVIAMCMELRVPMQDSRGMCASSGIPICRTGPAAGMKCTENNLTAQQGECENV